MIRAILILAASYAMLLAAAGCETLGIPRDPFAVMDNSVYPDAAEMNAERLSERPILPAVPAGDESFGAMKRWAANEDPNAPWAGLRRLFR